MANELTKTEQGLVSLVGSHDLGDIIKPLIKDVFLLDTYIAGVTHLDDDSVLDSLEVGTELFLRREDNKFDENAILVLNAGGKKLGYVPEKDNVVFARLMDAGKHLKAQVRDMDMGYAVKKIHISISLVDL